ncbi:MAG: hypothetical protein MK212_15815 [Saprospiraceae bacterium]|nr:hypothetical protein [Saprospiraceae bacterium]
MNKQLLTSIPVGTINGHVQFSQIPTSLVKKVHDEFIRKGQTMRHPTSNQLLIRFHFITDQGRIQEILRSWDAANMVNYLYKKTGSFAFIDAPLRIQIEQEDCFGGFLMYNEQGKIYFYAYYANFVGIYLYYKSRCPAGQVVHFSMDVMHTEILAYLCNNTIPRLTQKNLGTSQVLHKGR